MRPWLAPLAGLAALGLAAAAHAQPAPGGPRLPGAIRIVRTYDPPAGARGALPPHYLRLITSYDEPGEGRDGVAQLPAVAIGRDYVPSPALALASWYVEAAGPRDLRLALFTSYDSYDGTAGPRPADELPPQLAIASDYDAPLLPHPLPPVLLLPEIAIEPADPLARVRTALPAVAVWP